MRRLQCGTWTDREAVIACRSKQIILILFMAIKTWWRSRIYWLPWKIMLVHDISCPSNARCLVHVWCTTWTCTKFFQPYFYALIFIYDHLWESFPFMRIFLNLFLFMIICKNLFLLWESFWISSYLWSPVKNFSFYENLFESLLVNDHLWELSLYENKRACESDHLKQIFYHQNMIMIFC